MVGTPENGERSDLRLARFLFLSHPAKGSIVWVKCQTVAITLYLLQLLSCSFYQVLVIVQRDGVEPNSFAVKLRSHRLPVYPAGVRG